MSIYLIIFLVGTIIGSFLNVCIYRLPLKQSIIFPNSHCTHCKKSIPFYFNIPIISFLLLRGKCRNCKASIHWRYPLVELLNGLSYLYLFSIFGLSWPGIIYALLLSALWVVTFIDLEHQIIPDAITLPGIGLGLLAASTVLPPGFLNSLVGLLLGGGAFFTLWR